MKTADELKELKQEIETVSRKLHELTDEELEQVIGGSIPHIPGIGLFSSNLIEKRESRLR